MDFCSWEPPVLLPELGELRPGNVSVGVPPDMACNTGFTAGKRRQRGVVRCVHAHILVSVAAGSKRGDARTRRQRNPRLAGADSRPLGNQLQQKYLPPLTGFYAWRSNEVPRCSGIGSLLHASRPPEAGRLAHAAAEGGRRTGL